MAASSTDFVWYNDADDDYPIGQGPTDTSTASTPVDPLTPSSAGPSDRIRQLRGQPKIAINTSLTANPPTKAVARTRRKSTQKRSHPDNDMPPPRELRPKKAQITPIPINSNPETDGASDNQGSNSEYDDDGDLSAKDKCVSRSPVVHIPMIY
jgi:hypothetical protein